MKHNTDILAEQLGCDRLAIADTLFPIIKGYTETERFKFTQAIMRAMNEAREQDNWIEFSILKPEEPGEYIGYFPNGVEGSHGQPVVDGAKYDGHKLYSSFPNSTAHCFEASHWMKYPKKP